MRKVLSLCALLCALVFSGSAATAEDKAANANAATADPARIEAAKDLMDVTGVTKQFDTMMSAIGQGFAKGANAEGSEAGKQATAQFEAATKRFQAYKQDMMNDFAALYAETFTAEEMKAVADFYRSGVGAKFISMTPALMQKGAAIGMKYSGKMIEELKSGQQPGGAK